CPIAAPSANSFGKPSPTTAEHVKENMDGKIPLILDGGQCDVGIESTILDVSRDVPMLLLSGKISIEEIEAIIGTIEIHPSVTDPKQNQEIALSPGMKYRHYSPDAEVILITDNSKTKDIISECGNKKIGLITNDQNHALLVMDTFLYSKDLMSDLYYFLIELDKTVDVILIEGVDEKEVALMNRIKKAASRIV
ncbi:MAG: L-threonylcarbamoyladenylate synthase, partial [Candidatus Woesearchaeota archaeon]